MDGHGGAFEYGLDRPGHDLVIHEMTSGDPNECQRICRSDTRCRSFTLWIGSPTSGCVLKDDAPDWAPCPTCISGTREDNAGILEYGFDRPGQDMAIQELTSGDPNECLRICRKDTRCRAFTLWIGSPASSCVLKDNVPDWAPCPNCVSGINMAHEPSTNRAGGEYASLLLPENREELCFGACARDPQCKAYTFTFGSARCSLKSSMPAATTDSTTMSGVRRALEVGYDRPGNNIPSGEIGIYGQPLSGAASAAACANLCSRVSACRAFTWTQPGTPGTGTSVGSCALKKYPSWAPVQSPGRTSGVRRGLEMDSRRSGSTYRSFNCADPNPSGGLGAPSYCFTINTSIPPEQCQLGCAAEAQCVAWTWGPANGNGPASCSLKSTIGAKVDSPGSLSGIKGAEFF